MKALVFDRDLEKSEAAGLAWPSRSQRGRHNTGTIPMGRTCWFCLEEEKTCQGQLATVCPHLADSAAPQLCILTYRHVPKTVRAALAMASADRREKILDDKTVCST